MKKILLFVAIITSLNITAQEKITEGIIISKQTSETENAQLKAQLAAMGEMNTTTYFKGNKTRVELNNPTTGDMITITDNDTKDVLMLMDNPMIGKVFMTQKNEVNEEVIKAVTVTKGKETKKVLGYTCDQYFVTLSQPQGDVKIEVYTTPKITAESQQMAMLGNKVTGFPLYSVVTLNQMGSDIKIITEVTEVKKATVSDDKFDMNPPAEYKDGRKQ